MPPTIAQRRRVKPLALALKSLDNESRMFRYAVYVSAQYVLVETFPGERTKAILARADDCFSNLWPYVQHRNKEVTGLKQLYSQTFLAQYIPRPFSNRLWNGIERGDELVNSLRFLISMFWSTVSLYGQQGRQFLEETIHSFELLKGEQVARVKIIKEDGSVDTIFVLAATGEPLGRAQPTGAYTADSSHLRADWSDFLQKMGQSNVWNHLRCANSEDYVQGISKAWLQRTRGSNTSAERQVAERYILASVVANSVSGRQMNHLEMAAMDAGRQMELSKRSKGLSLYLSEHHHVEGVYIPTTFHPSIASVQTTHREYYVLRETGQQIGTEEEGVSETWQEILKCNANGTVKHE
ncbi:SubName: Full=Uncharacterized protein {ECO:0000313/EMBL:KIM31047.1} [Serendipita indica DSM 11827]|nr:SubName: Full=Uncharacterized protein {ECO:0000313/EMBL:KIM31047.1} [Serendipita indica DSM 11827]